MTIELSLSSSSVNSFGMPLVGFGTYQCKPEEAEASTAEALRVGYRHIDTAEGYRNEEGIGAAIVKSGIPRDQLFITTKLWPGYSAWNMPEKSYEDTIKACQTSLKKLQLDYVDLYLIHVPLASTRLDQYRALIQLQKDGLVKNIGVSNYGIVHLEEIIQAGLPLPCANQVELHPLCTQKALSQYMKQKGIEGIAYSSLALLSSWRSEDGQGGDKSFSVREQVTETVKSVASKYGGNEAKVLLRWGLQHGFAVLPKSTKPSRIRDNLDLFEFEISPEDMATLDALDRDMTLAWMNSGINPTKVVTPLKSE